MSTTGWLLAIVFGFGIVFAIFWHRDVREAYSTGTAVIDAQQAEFLARRERTMTGKTDPELDQRAKEARVRADTVRENNTRAEVEREPAVKGVEQAIEQAYGIKK